jgi:hypothetical protein
MVSNPHDHRVAVYADANMKSQIVAALVTGAQVAGIARTADNLWVLIQLPDGRQAWVFTSAVVVDAGYFSTLPIVAPDASKK